MRFETLSVWRKAHELTLYIYRTTEIFPKEERYGLTAQLRRAILSVGTNIAEGSERRTDKDFSYFLRIAKGSLAESMSLLFVARDLGYLTWTKEDNARLEEVAAMIYALNYKLSAVSCKREVSDG